MRCGYSGVINRWYVDLLRMEFWEIDTMFDMTPLQTAYIIKHPTD